MSFANRFSDASHVFLRSTIITTPLALCLKFTENYAKVPPSDLIALATVFSFILASRAFIGFSEEETFIKSSKKSVSQKP